MIKKFWWFVFVFLWLAACEQSASTVPPTPPTIVVPQPTPTCYVVVDMTSAAIYPVDLTSMPNDWIFYQGEVVETAVTGGVIKWTQLEICGNLRKYIDDFERPISIQLADQPLVEFVCETEDCPVTFTIPPETPIGRTKMIVQSGHTGAEFDVWIQTP